MSFANGFGKLFNGKPAPAEAEAGATATATCQVLDAGDPARPLPSRAHEQCCRVMSRLLCAGLGGTIRLWPVN